MVADLHVHYPMHVVADDRPRRSTLRRMRRVRGRSRWEDRFRALILNLASHLFNDRDLFSGWRVTTEHLRQGGVGLGMSVLYRPFEELDEPYRAPPHSSYFEGLLSDLEKVELDVLGQDPAVIRIVHDRRELERAQADGATALVHCVEGGFHLGSTVDEVRANVATLAERGVVYVTVAHLFYRQVATNAPALPFLGPDAVYNRLFPQPKGEGLTALGRAAVEEMTARRIMVDISHMSSAGIRETFALLDQQDTEGKVPVIASHGGYRFGDQEYMLEEATIREIQRRDGVIGLIMAQHQLNDGLRCRRTTRFDESLAVIFRHIDEIAKITGDHRHIALGTDLDGFIKPTMSGLEDSGQLKALERALWEEYGHDARLMCWENAHRVLCRVWA
jgi:membrane dipeptidase